MRMTNKVFSDLAIWMMILGVLTGVVFPFFTLLLGVPFELALSLPFALACLIAGALVGGLNFAMVRWVVGRRLRVLTGSMLHIEQTLRKMEATQDSTLCSPENCMIPVDSEDEIGQSAAAFNRLVETLTTSMHSQAASKSFAGALTSQLEIAPLSEQALNQFFLNAGASGGLILTECAGEMKLGAAQGLLNPERVIQSEPINRVIRTGQRVLIDIPEDVQVEGIVTEFRPRQVLVSPIFYKGVSVGILVLAAGSNFKADQLELIDLFLPILGLSLNNAITHDRLQRLAALDPLTGLYNRRFGMGRLHEEFGRSVRAQTPIGLLMLDIDHFKAVNDTYGHLVGDRLLKSVSSIMRSSLREGDVLVRYGGEEFLAVLPAASSDDLLMVGERVRRQVEDLILQESEKQIKVTISIGGCAAPHHQVSNEENLISKADEALYRAKNGGRNQVVIDR
ncbi:GGDEF domain-containing protein [Myxococcota bacterium]|nr:GGDEF domain-containing protein [Myxococcota bacterium]MBU1411655.1 GGDEF domain-containing protein [Myxococcota bacterium]MBU1512215.1 GGDEF domain-containing protein [Myxococcota bacterium]